MTEAILDRIMNSQLDKSSKLLKLWCVVMLNYRQDLGNKAWEKMIDLTDRETVDFIAMLSGWSMAAGIGLAKELGFDIDSSEAINKYETLKTSLIGFLREESDW